MNTIVVNDKPEDLGYEETYDWKDEETCPECGSHMIHKYPQMNKPDDYDWIYYCVKCGATQST